MSYSNDGSQFTSIRTDSYDIRGNTEKYSLGKQITCKHFKITYKTTTYSTGLLNYNGFDCYGVTKVLGRTRNTHKVPRIKMKLIENELIAIMTPIVWS